MATCAELASQLSAAEADVIAKQAAFNVAEAAFNVAETQKTNAEADLMTATDQRDAIIAFMTNQGC